MSKPRTLSNKELNLSPEPNKPPLYAEKFKQHAQEMLAEIETTPGITAFEKLARVAGAHIYMKLANGEMHPADMTKFLMSQFEKKTPAPIQKIEQETKTDLRIILADAIRDNPNILEMSTTKAIQARQDIQEKLALPPTLELSPILAQQPEVASLELRPSKDSKPEESTEQQGVSWNGEPDEIKMLRNPEEQTLLKGRRYKG